MAELREWGVGDAWVDRADRYRLAVCGRGGEWAAGAGTEKDPTMDGAFPTNGYRVLYWEESPSP